MRRVAGAIAIVSSALIAQSPAAIDAKSFVTPVHRGIARPGEVGGLWASGIDFKASFHDGFAFFPLLGAERPRNLPWRWTTVGVTRGGDTLPAATSPALRSDAQHVEMDHGAFVEVYDLRGDGVEQSFVFPAPIGGAGDLVVTGAIDSELLAAPTPHAHRALSFHAADGAPLVRYGEAFVVDAAGRRQAVTTSFDGRHVELRIDAGFLQRAAYPVRLDPLIARTAVNTGTAPVVDVDVIVAPDAGAPKLLVVMSRVFAGNDLDSYAVVAGTDFGNPVTVFADVDAAWGTKGGRCTYSGDAHRWAMVFERELFAPTTSEVFTYFHQRDNTTLNSGVSGTLSKPAGTTARNPDIGGRRVGGGWRVLVVYQTDPTTTQQNTINTEAWGVTVNAGSALEVSVPNTLDWFPSGVTYDREFPTVVKLQDGNFGYWIVSWHEFFPQANPDDWDVNLTRLDYNGIHQAQRYRLGLSVSPPHKRFPQLAGGDGRYLMAMTFAQSPATPMADEVHLQRFDWPDSLYDPVVGPVVVLAADAQNPDFAFPRLAFDENTRSHWTVAYRRGLAGGSDLFVRRVGADCSVLEAQTVFQSATQNGGPIAVGFAPQNGGSFPIVYATDEPGLPVFGTRLTYPSGAYNLPYGVGCGGTIGAPPPYRGSQFFAFTLSGAEPSQLAALGMATYATNAPLPFLPLGCEVLIGGDGGWVPVVTDALGDATVTIPLSTALPVGLTVFTQWLHLESSGSPAYLLATGGLETRIE
ncbi:MAG: hypothetical protein R3F29_01300 [Planctomycetota bacterium]